LDGFGDRTILSYHVRMSIEGIPHHAWSQDFADRTLSIEEALEMMMTRNQGGQSLEVSWKGCPTGWKGEAETSFMLLKGIMEVAGTMGSLLLVAVEGDRRHLPRIPTSLEMRKEHFGGSGSLRGEMPETTDSKPQRMIDSGFQS
jgi:hypothetical protein